MKLRKLFITLTIMLFTVFSLSASAYANKTKVGGGGSSGQYIQIAKAIADNAGKLFNCEGVTSGGSGDNMDKVASGEFAFGLTMGAVEQFRRANDPEYAKNTVLVRYIAYEALFAYAKPEIAKDFVNWQGVKDNGFLANFALPSKTSGDFLTFQQLQEGKDNGLAEAGIQNLKTRDSQIMAVVNETANIGFAAQFPNPKNNFFKSLKKKKLEIIPVMDMDLALESELYRVQDVKIGKQLIETMVVPVALIARVPEAYENARQQKIQKVLIKKFKGLEEKELLPKKGFFAKMMENATVAKSTSWLQQKKEQMMEAAKAAKANFSD